MNLRKALISDEESVLAFCKNTFFWGDYIDQVWNSWISEGDLYVIDDNGYPVALCHATTFDDANMVWIEGIRVKESYRRKGFANKLITESEFMAKNKNCTKSKMLIEYSNMSSIGLVESLGYKRESKWNFFSLEPMKVRNIPKIQYPTYQNGVMDFLSKNLSFVDSWKWLPFVEPNKIALKKKNQIICNQVNEKTTSLAIYTISKLFEKSINLTILFGNSDGLTKILTWIQNLADNKSCKKIYVFTELEQLPKIPSLKKKLLFYLMTKDI
ncbi:MAG: GNAT family N-acetyltransferase [Nitrosopumilus sp.]|nr:GNAT family N-acetyltransferase [Nitrosopumilus sp.]